VVRKDRRALGKNEARLIRSHRKVRELRKACKHRRPLHLVNKDNQRRLMVSHHKVMVSRQPERRTVNLRKGNRMGSHHRPVCRTVKLRKGNPLANHLPERHMVNLRKGNPMAKPARRTVKLRKGSPEHRMVSRSKHNTLLTVRHHKRHPSDSPEMHSRKILTVRLLDPLDLHRGRMAKRRKDPLAPRLEPRDNNLKDTGHPSRALEPQDKTLAPHSNPTVGSVNPVQA